MHGGTHPAASSSKQQQAKPKQNSTCNALTVAAHSGGQPAPHLDAAALGLRVAAVLGAAATLLVGRLNGQRHGHL